ncbi:MAG: hypothetical protein GF307_11335, partial [candidate division Zixibacteria bacterium]|nr:hypothetical protein [candidate division Zixibacteria bacterium]
MRALIIAISVIVISLASGFQGHSGEDKTAMKDEREYEQYIGVSYDYLRSVNKILTRAICDSFGVQMTRCTVQWGWIDGMSDEKLKHFVDSLYPNDAKLIFTLREWHPEKMRTEVPPHQTGRFQGPPADPKDWADFCR